MAPRRTHKKSRSGCDTCRTRHVKCDEQGPPCTRCKIRDLDCTFTKRLTSRQSAVHPSVDTVRRQTSVSSISTLVLGQSLNNITPSACTRLLELELLHFYSTKTYQGFALLSPDQDFWKVFAVEEALKFDFLMKEIFALAALHKAIEAADLASQYFHHALDLQNQALALARNALQNIDQENSSAVFMFSIMAMIFAIVPPNSVPGISLRSPLENILMLFELQKGTAMVTSKYASEAPTCPFRFCFIRPVHIKTIVYQFFNLSQFSSPRNPANFVSTDLCREWLELGPFRWIFGSKTSNNIINIKACRNEDCNEAFVRLRALNNEYATAHPVSAAVFVSAISSLSFCSDGNKGRVLAWLAMAGQDFMTNVNEKEPMALLILLHWAVLLIDLNDLWWAKNAGARLIEDVVLTLEKVEVRLGNVSSPEWAKAIEWARCYSDSERNENPSS